MGGISNGYEAAIQDCAIDIMKSLSSIEVPKERQEFSAIVGSCTDDAVNRLDGKYGFSGAQVGAAKNLASVFWRQSPIKGLQMMKDQDIERIIKISKGDNESVVVHKKFTMDAQ